VVVEDADVGGLFMLRKQFSALSLLSLVLLFTQGCKVVVPDKVSTDSPNSNGSTDASASLACTVTLSSVTAALSGTPVPILVTATGGTSPYTMPGQLGTFASFMTVTRTYDNESSANIILDDSGNHYRRRAEFGNLRTSSHRQAHGGYHSTFECRLPA